MQAKRCECPTKRQSDTRNNAKHKAMRMGIIKKIGKRYSVCVDGWSILPYFDDENQADFVCANRLGKLQKELNKVRIPFVKMWIAW